MQVHREPVVCLATQVRYLIAANSGAALDASSDEPAFELAIPLQATMARLDCQGFLEHLGSRE